MPCNEADTRAELIDPQFKAAGWTDRQVTREHYYRRDHFHTAGRIYLRAVATHAAWTTCCVTPTPSPLP